MVKIVTLLKMPGKVVDGVFEVDLCHPDYSDQEMVAFLQEMGDSYKSAWIQVLSARGKPQTHTATAIVDGEEIVFRTN